MIVPTVYIEKSDKLLFKFQLIFKKEVFLENEMETFLVIVSVFLGLIVFIGLPVCCRIGYLHFYRKNKVQDLGNLCYVHMY